MTESKNITFFSGGAKLVLDEYGFHYNGQTVSDAGEAHKLFIQFMNNAGNSLLTNCRHPECPTNRRN